MIESADEALAEGALDSCTWQQLPSGLMHLHHHCITWPIQDIFKPARIGEGRWSSSGKSLVQNTSLLCRCQHLTTLLRPTLPSLFVFTCKRKLCLVSRGLWQWSVADLKLCSSFSFAPIPIQRLCVQVSGHKLSSGQTAVWAYRILFKIVLYWSFWQIYQLRCFASRWYGLVDVKVTVSRKFFACLCRLAFYFLVSLFFTFLCPCGRQPWYNS